MNSLPAITKGTRRRRAFRGRLILRITRSWAGRIGLAIAAVMFMIAMFGPLLAPYPPNALLGIPYTGPSGEFLLGTDFLGRDVLSRLLSGGRTLVALAGLATALAYLIGAPIGLFAGYGRSVADPVLMRAMDALLAFPPLLLLLVLATGLGPGVVTIVAGTTIVQVPGIARIMRTATVETSVRGYVEAAAARGEPRRYLLFREILPNITGTITADIGPRLTISILVIAGLNFFGIGVQPPSPDWGTMITENRAGLTLQPWAIVAPALLIAFLTISVNMVADAIARTVGTSIDETLVRR